MDITFSLKFIDKIIGRGLCRLFSRPRSGNQDKKTTILLIRPGGIGDAVQLASSIKCIKTTNPDSHITILAERRNSGIYVLMPQVDKVICYDHPREFIQALQGRYDVVIDTEQWYQLSAVVARLVKAPVKIGFDTNERRRMFTHAVPYDQNAYESDNFVSLLKPLGIDCRSEDNSTTLELPLQAVSKADDFLQPIGSYSFVVIFSGASVAEKRWGEERFRQVAQKLSDYGYRIVVVGGKENRAEGDLIIDSGWGINLAGKTTLAETAAVIDRSSFVISGDSGVLHIAAGLNIPTVSLFGPSSSLKWAPQGDKHIVVNHHLPCSPCSKFGTIPPCPIDARCMHDISVDEVINAVTTILDRVGTV